MNKRFHRVVWNAARKLKVVVQETARAAGKGGGATALVSAAALMAGWPVQAQIAGAPGVAPGLRPTVLVAPNGVPLVNIQTPSAAGVSRNLYHQFDVQRNGVILNNSRTDVQTQLGGWVQGNPFLATGPARIILNEIVSGKVPEQLSGEFQVRQTMLDQQLSIQYPPAQFKESIPLGRCKIVRIALRWLITCS